MITIMPLFHFITSNVLMIVYEIIKNLIMIFIYHYNFLPIYTYHWNQSTAKYITFLPVLVT